MTTIFPVEKQCAHCGRHSEHVVIGSTNTFGSPDLDTRPPEMMRSTIPHWVQRCPHCGYCNSDLAELLPMAAQVMHSEAYRDQLVERILPSLANSFLCSSIILAAQGEFTRAGWSSLHAAWVCDDERAAQGALHCRQRTVNLFQEALANGQMIARQADAGDALLVDVLRRSLQFTLALSLCEDGLRKHSDEIIKGVLTFQKLLIQRQDSGCYTVAQALGNA